MNSAAPHTTGQKDTMLHLRVLAVLKSHSITNPITGQALATSFGVEWRKIADIVNLLRRAGHKIGSSKGAKDSQGNATPMGYFLATDPSEIAGTVKHMKDEAIEILTLAKKLESWDETPTLFEQVDIYKLKEEFGIDLET